MKLKYIFSPFIFLLFLPSLFLLGCTGNSLTFLVRFPEIAGLQKSDHVYFGGNEIGRVNKVTYTSQGDYLVELEIKPEFKNAATEDSKFYIGQSPRNTSALAIIVEQEHPGGILLKNGITVQGSARAGYFDHFFNDLQKTAGKAESELNKALENMKKSFDATSEKMDRKLEAAINDLSRQLESSKEGLEKIPDSQEMHQLEESFRQFSDEFQKAQKDVQDQIRNEILPRFRAELEHLRDLLKKEGREEELKPIDKQINELEMV